MRRSLPSYICLIFTLVFGLCFGLPNLAHAQFGSPTDIVTPAPAFQFGQKNQQLKTLLSLQNQLQLLHRLIDHENAVNQMVEAAIGVGITDPFIPTPDKQLCLEVPANIPCAQSYTALYKDYSVEKKKPTPLPVSPPPVTTAQVETAAKATIAKVKKIVPKVIETVFTPLYWTDITCLGEKCSAVISDNPRDPKASYRVAAGEKLADGSTVNNISAAGVSVLRNKKIVQIDPAPRASDKNAG